MTGNWGQGGPLSPFQRLHPLRARDSAKSSMCQERIPFPKSCAQTSLSPSALSNSTKILGQQPMCCSDPVSRDNRLSHCVRMCICVYVCETSLSASNPNSTVMLYRILPSFSFTHKHSCLCETHPELVFLVRQVLTVAYERFRRQALGDCGFES